MMSHRDEHLSVLVAVDWLSMAQSLFAGRMSQGMLPIRSPGRD